MESTASNATPDKSEMKNEISINQKYKFESKNYNTGDVMKSKYLKRQSSLDATSIQGKKDGTLRNATAQQENRDVIHQKIEGILHKGSDNYGNYNRVNKGIQASFDNATQLRSAHGKNIKYSKSLDEAAYLNKNTQTSLENINNPTQKIPSSYSLDGTHQHARRKKLEQIASDYYETEKQKIATVIEEQPVRSAGSKKLHLDLSGDEQEWQSVCYQKKMMSALNHNKSITPTDYEDKSFVGTLYDRSTNLKQNSDNYRKSGTGTSNNGNHRVEKSKGRGHCKEQTSTPDEEHRTEPNMKKSLSIQNYSESSKENCSNQSYEKYHFRPTTKSFSFDLEKREKSESSNRLSGRQDFVKISKSNCDILRKQTSQRYETAVSYPNQELKSRGDKKALILHKTKFTHPLESEPVEAIIGQGFADDRRIQTPLVRQRNERNQMDGRTERDICYWTTRNSRKNSTSMISDEAIIGKGFLDDEEFIDFYSTKQPRLKQVPEDLKPSTCVPAEMKKESPKFNLNKNEIKKYFLLHGNNEPVRANIKCEQGIYKEVPVKPIVKKVINVNENYNEELHFNLNYEVAAEVQNEDQNNNHYNTNVGNNEEKLYGKRDLNQNEYVELGGGKAKAPATDHHYEVLHKKYNANDADKLYEVPREVPRILHDATLEDDVFADEKTVKNMGEYYLNIPSTKYRKSPMLWYINDQVISFHHDIPAIVANKKISLPVSSNIRPLGFPSSTNSYYSLHNFDMHRQNPQMKNTENYTSLIRPLILG